MLQCAADNKMNIANTIIRISIMSIRKVYGTFCFQSQTPKRTPNYALAKNVFWYFLSKWLTAVTEFQKQPTLSRSIRKQFRSACKQFRILLNTVVVFMGQVIHYIIIASVSLHSCTQSTVNQKANIFDAIRNSSTKLLVIVNQNLSMKFQIIIDELHFSLYSKYFIL